MSKSSSIFFVRTAMALLLFIFVSLTSIASAEKQEWIDKDYNFNNVKRVLLFNPTIEQKLHNGVNEHEILEIFAKKAKLPKNIEVIGAYAFKDNNLATLTLPKSLKSINWGAFQNNNLSTIKLKEKTSLIISDYAFKGNRFTMVKLNKTTSYAKMSFDETVTLLK